MFIDMERNERLNNIPDWLKRTRKNYLAKIRRYAKKHKMSLAVAKGEIDHKAEEDAQDLSEY